MQVLILAAGMGKRLADLTEQTTKCMVHVNGVPLINRALDVLTDFDLSRIVIVVGYKGEKLKEHLGDTYNNVPIEYVENPIYDITNNIYSLFLAKDLLDEDDTLLVESDLIFNRSIIEKALAYPENENAIVVDKYQAWMEGTVAEIDKNKQVTRFLSKNEFKFRDVEDYYKTVNIYRFSKEFSKKHYSPFLEAYCKSVGHNEYYENVLKVLAFLDSTKLNACVLSEEDKWYEIDDKQDLHNAETLFSDDIMKYQHRYGGYWRFPFLKDFCYLVNPYFPPKKMVDEYKAYFEILLHDYPSTGSVQNMLAAKMFNCEQENIIVGNGAAELISNLMSSFGNETIGVITPTFHEYVARTPKDKIRTFTPVNDDFSYTAGNLKTFSKEIDTLLLINPDNPSGNFIPKDLVLELISDLKESGKKLILDESFVDFSSENDKNTLIEKDVISKYDNLIIIKSVSKSYGVPGIRLGVMVSSNLEILKVVKEKLPVWNINSFGEFFFQIYGKYESSYKDACKNIASERDRLYNELKSISFLRPIYSQANYFLCEVIGISASSLTSRLMKHFNVLLKDCTGKTGFEDKEFIRIAVRDYSDNEYLLDSLRRVWQKN
ncbi:MAG: aminotransferase class I/II-fold pyridoxal phosphate-dependent enzyme [Bacteroidales bacterium]|nr:aminotransferase class I/II-fold pyridoxal phosphate-dependent enzyme [Bacteroidales bacterium]